MKRSTAKKSRTGARRGSGWFAELLEAELELTNLKREIRWVMGCSTAADLAHYAARRKRCRHCGAKDGDKCKCCPRCGTQDGMCPC
jgi:hypothetical protein